MTNINIFAYHTKPGFLLLDIMVGIVLMSIFMLIIGYYTFAIVEHHHDTQLTLQALDVATQYLDRCIHMRQLPVHTTQNVGQFSLVWHTQHHELPVLSRVPTPVQNDQNERPLFNVVNLTVSFKTLRGFIRSQVLAGSFFSTGEHR